MKSENSDLEIQKVEAISNEKTFPLEKVKGAGKWILSGFLPPIGAIKRAFGWEQMVAMFASIKQSVRNYFSVFSSSRDPTASNAPDLSDFGQVLDAWGIGRDNESIQRAISFLKIRWVCTCTMSVVFIVVVLVGWQGRVTQYLAVTMCGVLFFVTCITHIWRIKVLSTRKFVFFSHWLFGRR